MDLLLIDGDVLVYRCGFASDHRLYDIRDEDDTVVHTAEGAKQRNAWLSTCPESEAYSWQLRIEPEPVNFALQIVNTTLKTMFNNLNNNNYTLYLSGKDNFRDRLATIQPYKANRKDALKPTHYDAIREYMMEHKHGVMVEGMEADDELALQQTENTVICSIDKDMLQVPGWHYNFVTENLKLVEEFEGLVSFYAQLLSGDATDHIPGIKGIGPAKALKALEGCFSETALWKTVCTMYENTKVYTLDQVLEIGNLLWLKRRDREFWFPPGMEDDGRFDAFK